jgi:molybdopterin synthase catalytic subunit
MRFDVRLFALYRERAGASIVSVDVPDASTVGELTAAVRADYPRLAPPEVRIVVAVNAEYADDEQVLQPGDEVCLIPPVSGGRL